MINGKLFHTMCQLNVGGLSRHSQIAIDKYVADNMIEILALQEVGQIAQDDKQDQEEVFSNLTSFWHYGCHGVGLSINPRFKPQGIKDLSDSNIDSIFVLCKINNKGVLVVSCYCRPEISSSKSLKLLLKNLDDAWSWCLSKKISSMLVLGDFNARSTKWGDSTSNARGKLLSCYIEEKAHVCLHSPATQTFLTSNGGSIIDLTLSYGDIKPYISTPWTERCFSLFTGAPIRGHLPVFQTLEVSGNQKSNAREVFNYDAANWEGWSADMERMFSKRNEEIVQASKDNEPALLFDFFLQTINECNENFIPKKSVCNHSKPYWSNNLSELSKELQDSQKKYRFKSDPHNKSVLESCKTKFQETLIKEKNCWIHGKLDGLNTSESIEFWKRYKKQFIKQSEPSVSHLYTDETMKTLMFKDEEKEPILFDTFFTGKHLKQNDFDEKHHKKIEEELDSIKVNNWDIKPEGNVPQNSNLLNDESSFLNDEISVNEVLAAIKEQKTSGKCSDGDKLHPLILKRLPMSCIMFLALMFNKVLSSGNWVWNSSMVTFIRKAEKDSYLVPGAYRPISIASYVGKIMERVLSKRLLLFCQKEQIIDEAQEGFLPQRNTSRYLYKMTASIAEARRRRMTAMILFIDFEKAFDSVPTASLIVKLNRYGIDGNFLRLIYSFLSSRKMTLKVNDYIGPERKACYIGLPQGSVLSPLLFIIFVADLLSPKDLPLNISGQIHSYKYADDGSILIAAKTTIECHQLMQKTCNYLNAWCKKWRLLINCSKNKTECIIMKSKDSQSTLVPKLKIGNKELQYVKKSKVLGVIFDEDLKFDKHANYVLKNCWYAWYRLSDHTTRKKGLNSPTLAILFKTAVMTKLLYAAPVWLNKNLDVFSDLLSRALLKINGAQLFIPNVLAEVIANIPPLCLTLEMFTIKFCLKGLTTDNEMQAFIMQLEDTPAHPFYKHTLWIKQYIAVKNELKSYRSINLYELTEEDLFYTKAKMDSYQHHRWSDQIRKMDIAHFLEKDSHITEESLEMIQTENISHFPLLHRWDKRSTTSDILDFIHGRCLLFNKFKKNLGQSSSSTCEDCDDMAEDTSAHKLLKCPAFDGSTRINLMEMFSHSSYPNNDFRLSIVFGENAIKEAFRAHVEHILQTTVSSDGYQG